MLFAMRTNPLRYALNSIATARRVAPYTLSETSVAALSRFCSSAVSNQDGNAVTSDEKSGNFADLLDPEASPLHEICADVASARRRDGLHEPVMPAAALAAWVPSALSPSGEGAVFIDTTIGHAGHAEALLRAYPHARLLGLDADGEMVAKARKALNAAGVGDRATLVKAPFSHLREVMKQQGIPAAHGVLADIGFNSGHVSNATRGFAFRADGRLDGRFDAVSKALMLYNIGFTACCSNATWGAHIFLQSITGATNMADIVNKCSFGQLVSLLRHKGGENTHERAIARAIVEWRGRGARKRRIASTLELRFVIESAVAVALNEPPVASSRADSRFAQRQSKYKHSTDFKRKGRMPGVWDRESVWITKKDQDKLVRA
jgi:16S rRNA C1402 N4-methylase RsmH